MNLVPPSIRIFFGATAAEATMVALAGAEALTIERRAAFLLLATCSVNLMSSILLYTFWRVFDGGITLTIDVGGPQIHQTNVYYCILLQERRFLRVVDETMAQRTIICLAED